MKSLGDLYEELVEYYTRFYTMPGVWVEREISKLQERDYSRKEVIIELYKKTFKVKEIKVVEDMKFENLGTGVLELKREKFIIAIIHMLIKINTLFGVWSLYRLVCDLMTRPQHLALLFMDAFWVVVWVMWLFFLMLKATKYLKRKKSS